MRARHLTPEGCLSGFPLSEKRPNASNVPPNDLDARVVRQLSGRILEAQIEQLFLQVLQSAANLGLIHPAKLYHFHWITVFIPLL